MCTRIAAQGWSLGEVWEQQMISVISAGSVPRGTPAGRADNALPQFPGCEGASESLGVPRWFKIPLGALDVNAPWARAPISPFQHCSHSTLLPPDMDLFIPWLIPGTRGRSGLGGNVRSLNQNIPLHIPLCFCSLCKVYKASVGHFSNCEFVFSAISCSYQQNYITQLLKMLQKLNFLRKPKPCPWFLLTSAIAFNTSGRKTRTLSPVCIIMATPWLLLRLTLKTSHPLSLATSSSFIIPAPQWCSVTLALATA